MVKLVRRQRITVSGCSVKVNGSHMAWYTQRCRFVGATKYLPLLNRHCRRCA